MRLYGDTWWFGCKWVVIDLTEAFCLWGRLIPRCLSRQGSETLVPRWDKNAALTFEASVSAAPIKSHLHELCTNSALFAVFHFLLLARISLPRLVRRVLRFVFLLCSDLTSPEREAVFAARVCDLPRRPRYSCTVYYSMSTICFPPT